MKGIDKRAIYNTIFGMVIPSVIGFFLGLRKIVWTFWAVISVLWVAFWLWAGERAGEGSEDIYLVITFGAPMFLFFALLLLQAVMEAFGRIAGAISSPNQNESVSKPGQQNLPRSAGNVERH